MKRKRAPAPSAPPRIAAISVPRGPLVLGILAAAAFAFLGLAFISVSAPTYDEPVHLASGYSYWKTGRYRLNISDHPPLAEMWASVPLLFLRPALMSGLPDFINGRRYPYADAFLYKNTVDAERMLNAARRFCLLTLGAGVLALLAAWGRRLDGWEAAAGAALAAALCPVLVSNLALVGTDGASAVLFAAVCFFMARPARPPWVWGAAGTCLGLALGAKFNMILLAGLIPGMLLLERGIDREGVVGMKPARGLALLAAAAMLALAVVYRFDQLPLFWSGLRATLGRLDEGRASYLLGGYSERGTLLYFPAALFAKTPLALLVLGAWGAAAAARRPRPAERLWLLVPPAAYFLASLTAKVQIGVRHLLPVLPFLALWAGLAAADLWRRGQAARLAVAALAVWAGASVQRGSPHLLAYFNEAAGGPANGWRWLADSNLDWGQDLKGLAEELKRRGDPPVYLAYFGVGDPSYYGVRYVQALANWNVPRAGDALDPAAQGKVLFAVSATNLAGVYIGDHGFLAWLQARAPLAAAGHSIFLYDLTADADGRRRLAELLVRSGHPNAAGLSKSLLLQ